jgi:acid stress-induced BolA-like protein IbaG/YrbA
MAILASDIEALIRAGFPDAKITISGDDGQHYFVEVIDESFRGMSRVEQSRAVKATVKTQIDSGELHAMGLTTKVPE